MLDVHVLLEQHRVLKVTVNRSLRAVQILAVHSVRGVQDAVERRPEVADVPHPLEDGRNVRVACAEAKHREQDRQDGTDEDGELELEKEIIH